MELGHRPYVAPETEPGDAGTEEWADGTPVLGDLAQGATGFHPAHKLDPEGAPEGSPADVFIHHADTIAARNDVPDQA